MPAQQGSWIATAYLETGTIAKGQVACLNEAGTRYVVASDTNRTAAGRRSACIAITAGDADDPGGSSFEAQYVGAVPPSITGLGAGTESLIRVSDAGVLERVAEYSTSDDVCGHCDADGTAYVCFPLVGLGSALGASSAPGLPDHSVQYYYDANTLGGATGVSIDGTGSALQLGTGTFATVGLVRLPYNTGTVVAVRDGGGTDRAIITSSTQLTFGSLAGYITNVEGTGLVLRANTGGRLVVNSNILEFRDGSSNFVFSFDMPNALFQTACVRFGAGTAWGASEGEVTISSTGTVTVSNVQYNQLSQKFSGATGGTYTYPAPANAGYSYIKLLEETGGADKTITIGSGTTYTLAAYTRRIVKFTPTGVFEIGASTTATEGQMSNTLTGGTYSLTPTAKILKFSGSPGGTDTITLPTPGSAAASNVLHFRNTSTNTAITFKLASGVTFTTGYNSVGTLFVTPDGVSGYSLNTIPGVSAVTT